MTTLTIALLSLALTPQAWTEVFADRVPYDVEMLIKETCDKGSREEHLCELSEDYVDENLVRTLRTRLIKSESYLAEEDRTLGYLNPTTVTETVDLLLPSGKKQPLAEIEYRFMRTSMPIAGGGPFFQRLNTLKVMIGGKTVCASRPKDTWDRPSAPKQIIDCPAFELDQTARRYLSPTLDRVLAAYEISPALMIDQRQKPTKKARP